MPRRRLVSDGLRGYGWEGEFNAVLRMSQAAMWATNVQNEREKFLHRKTLAQLGVDKRDAVQKMDRTLGGLRKELIDLTAYRRVYEHNRFANWEKRRREKVESLSFEQSPGACKHLKTPSNALHISGDFNQQFSPGKTWGIPASQVNATTKAGGTKNEYPLPKVETYPEKGWLWRGQNNGGADDQKLQKARKKISRLVNVRKPKLRERENQRVSSFLPAGCKGVFFIHRFIEKEAAGMLREMDPSYMRKKRAEKLVKTVKMPVLIDYKRSTSAIMQEFSSGMKALPGTPHQVRRN